MLTDITKMIPEKEIVTKKYLERQLSPVRDEINSLRVDLRAEMKEQKFEIIREVKIMLHEALESTMDNMKAYYDERSDRYMKMVLEQFRDDLKVYKDSMGMLKEKIDDHEIRLQTAGI